MIEIVGVPLTQWDVKRQVKVTGDAEYVHFANPGDSKAVKLPLNNGMSEIPEYLLQTGKALNVYAVLDGVTLESRSFAVRKRERPADYIYEPNQRDYIYTLIDEANKAIKNANDAAEELREAIKNGDIVIPEGGGAEVLNVWVEGTEADHTSLEIFAHVDNIRGPVQLQYNDAYYQLLRADESVAWFGYIADDGHIQVVCVNGNEIEDYPIEFVHMSYFEETIGDMVKTVNGISPDENGNVKIEGSGPAEGAVLYIEQTLTEEQKAQARENIGAMGDGDEVEVLPFTYTTSYPNTSTFAYTKKDTVSSYWAFESKTAGGKLFVDWDVNEVRDTIDCQLYLKALDGTPYKFTPAVDTNGKVLGTGFSENSTIYWQDPGKGSAYPHALRPFTVEIPTGYTVLVGMRTTGATFPAGSSITSESDFAQKAPSIFTVTLTKESAVKTPVSYKEQTLTEEQKARARANIGAAEEVSPSASVNPLVKSVNHRGYGTAPENTLAAFRLSKEKGFDIVECDVNFTADGVAVLLHDDTVDRTSNGTGTISELTFEYVRSLDFGSWKSAEYTGEKIPTFEEFIALCRQLGLHPYIELKTGTAYTQENVNTLVSIVKKYGMLNNVTWISSANASLGYVKTAHESARLGLVRWSVTATNLPSSGLLNLKNDSNEVFLDADASTLADDAVTWCIENNMPIEVFGVNTENAVISANPYISGFTTDTVVAGVALYKNSI